MAALAALGCLVAALLLFVTGAPQTRLDFPIDRQPVGVVAHGLYDLERNAAGPYRWTMPGGSISVPVAAPGTYRLDLVLQDTPLSPSPRTIVLYVAGRAVDTLAVDASPRPYSATIVIAPERWARESRSVTVEWQTSPLRLPSDTRALGLVLTEVRVVPVAGSAPLPLGVFVPLAGLFLLGYGGMRLLGLKPWHAAALGALAVLGLAALAAVDRGGALRFGYRALTDPFFLFGAVLFLSPLPFAARRFAGSRFGRLRGESDPEAAAPNRERRFWSRASLPLAPLLLLAFALRIWGYDRLSLWRDEGYTVYFGQLPWTTLLGLREVYDVHPPFYYLVTKAVALVVAERHAGRLVSVIAGTLSIAALYGCAVRLLGRRAAPIAALVVTLSPLHLWYSQEARMYALSFLLVALSYYALIALREEGSYGWVALYGVSTLLALYTDMTALYALVPQLFLWVGIWRAARRRALIVAGVALSVGGLFLPWVLRNAAVSGLAAQRGAAYLEIGGRQFGESALAMIGLDSGGYYWGAPHTPWNDWAVLRPVFVVAALVILGVAFFQTLRHAAITPLVIAALTTATFGVAALVSVVVPGFADRTVLAAVCGWGLFAGAAWCGGGPRRFAIGVRVGLTGLILLAAITAGGIARSGTKQDYLAFATAVAAAAATPVPILTNDPISETLLVLYQPRELTGRYQHVDDLTVHGVAASYLRDPGVLWFAYANYSFLSTDRIARELLALGFERRSHRQFPIDLALDLYARPGVQLSQASVPIRFAPTWEVVSPPIDAAWHDLAVAGAHDRARHAAPRRRSASAAVTHG